jgi:hypothetical protein
VCDRKKFDNIGMGKFEGKSEADGVCKLLNSIEEEAEFAEERRTVVHLSRSVYETEGRTAVGRY